MPTKTCKVHHLVTHIKRENSISSTLLPWMWWNKFCSFIGLRVIQRWA